MKRTWGLAALLAATGIVLATAHAVQERAAAKAGPPSLADLGWLCGAWEENAGGARTEEFWSPAHAGSMVGTCRMSKDGKVTLYEFLLIEQKGDVVEMRIRHYRWNMEDMDKEPFVWQLTKADATQAVFENPAVERVRRVEYRREGDAGISCSLVSINDGHEIKKQFRFQKAAGVGK